MAMPCCTPQRHDPARDHIGIEVHAPGVGRALSGIEHAHLDNVRIYRHDALEVLRNEIAPNALDEVRIYFPDPWHKKRHHKRRLVNVETCALIADRLRSGGLLHLATDWQPYAEQMWDVLDAQLLLRNRAGVRGSPVPRPDWRPQTRFETSWPGSGPRRLSTCSTSGSDRPDAMDASTNHALTSDMVVVLCLVTFTTLMFMIDRIRADVVALIVLVALGLSRIVPTDRLFDGFSGNAVISVMATMILGAGLDRTGLLNRLAGWLLRRSRGLEERMVMLTSAVAGLISPSMQNPSVMSLFLPVASRLSARTGVAPSRLLLPIVSAIIMGGSLTMVGNSPLILLNDLLLSANRNIPSGVATLVPLKMFAPFPIGAALLAAWPRSTYRWFGGRWIQEGTDRNITPGRTESYFSDAYGIDGEVFELTVTSESPIVGMSVGEVEVQKGAPLLLALRTGEESRLAPPADQMLWVGSVIGVMGTRQNVEDYAQANMLRMSSRLRQFGDLFNPSLAGISEAVVPPNSHFIGKKLSDIRLRSEHGISVLAINRDGQVHREDIRDIALKAGDMLVLHSDLDPR